jgi:glycosyltransferase involved in cell wall biosynthesis
MIVGYDAKRLFHNYTGLGYYSRTLVNSLCDNTSDFKAVLFDRNPVKNEITTGFFDQDNMDQVRLLTPSWYYRSIRLNAMLTDHALDCYHGLSNELPGVRLPSNIPEVVTIHDVLFKSFHEDFPWLDRQIYHFKMKAAIRNASTIVVISQATKSDLIKHYPDVPVQQIKVIYQSYDPIFDQAVSPDMVDQTLKELQLPAEYMLYVGSITRRKNLGILLEALSILPEKDRIPLVIAGKGSVYEGRMKKFIHERALESWVHFLPGLTRLKLRYLYEGAQAVIYPSLGEGFGLPVLEAIAANIPVITSGISSMPEAGGDLAIYFDPGNKEELAFHMRNVNKQDFQKTSVSKRTMHLAKFSRHAIARQYIDEVYAPLTHVQAETRKIEQPQVKT